MLDECIHFIIGSWTVLNDFAREVQGLSCHRVVGVNGNAIGIYADDACHEAILFGIHERDDGTGIDVLGIKFAIDHEYFAL